MRIDPASNDLQSLLARYNQEIDTLKARLLNGESWEKLAPTRRKITELAIAIHKSHGYLVPDYMLSELDGQATGEQRPDSAPV